MISHDLIPQEKAEAVGRSLRVAFGVEEFQGIRSLTKGQTSALVYRVVVKGTPYLLRIIMRPDDPTVHFRCMKAAAEAGLAPRVWYTNVEDKISITDFIEAVPFAAAEARARMPRLLRNLHALPPFPTRAPHLNTSCTFLLNREVATAGLIQRFQALNLVPESECAAVLERYTQVLDVYAPDNVSSHNDLFKPDNILFDGERVWLVDWEAAFLNDRYADLAVVANLIVTKEKEERAYLQDYFGAPADAYQRARFYVMQQIVHMFYAMAFLFLASMGGPVELKESLPGLGEFHQSFWDGECDLESRENKIIFGRLHWEALLGSLRGKRFDEALQVVGAGRPASL